MCLLAFQDDQNWSLLLNSFLSILENLLLPILVTKERRKLLESLVIEGGHFKRVHSIILLQVPSVTLGSKKVGESENVVSVLRDEFEVGDIKRRVSVHAQIQMVLHLEELMQSIVPIRYLPFFPRFFHINYYHLLVLYLIVLILFKGEFGHNRTIYPFLQKPVENMLMVLLQLEARFIIQGFLLDLCEEVSRWDSFVQSEDVVQLEPNELFDFPQLFVFLTDVL